MGWNKITSETDIQGLCEQKIAIGKVKNTDIDDSIAELPPVFEISFLDIERKELMIRPYNPLFPKDDPSYTPPLPLTVEDLIKDWYYNDEVLPAGKLTKIALGS